RPAPAADGVRRAAAVRGHSGEPRLRGRAARSVLRHLRLRVPLLHVQRRVLVSGGRLPRTVPRGRRPLRATPHPVRPRGPRQAPPGGGPPGRGEEVPGGEGGQRPPPRARARTRRQLTSVAGRRQRRNSRLALPPKIAARSSSRTGRAAMLWRILS